MTSFTVSVNCVWLLITGGATEEVDRVTVTDPNTVVIDLGKKNTSQLLITVYSQFSSSQVLLLIIMERIYGRPNPQMSN